MFPTDVVIVAGAREHLWPAIRGCSQKCPRSNLVPTQGRRRFTVRVWMQARLITLFSGMFCRRARMPFMVRGMLG